MLGSLRHVGSLMGGFGSSRGLLQEHENRMSRRLSTAYLESKVVHAYLRMFVHPPSELATIPGYLHPVEGRCLYWLAGKVPPGGLALEVGSFKGKSSVCLAAGLGDTARLACVDTWRNDAMPYDAQADVMPEFLQNTKRFSERIEPHRGRSAEIAASWTRPIDLLFIDGDHSYEGCSGDLRAWMPFVRPGGWVTFHDSSEVGVARAISEFLPRAHRSLEFRAWSIYAARKRKKID
jgi:predicted O-methyltransferase YrrM